MSMFILVCMRLCLPYFKDANVYMHNSERSKCPHSSLGCLFVLFFVVGRGSPSLLAPVPASWQHSFCPTVGVGSEGEYLSSLSQ